MSTVEASPSGLAPGEDGGLRQPVAARGPARRHPDRRTSWAIVMIARLGDRAPSTELLLGRLRRAFTAFPLLAARLEGGWWVPGAGPAISSVLDEDPLEVVPLQPFDLEREAPLRLLVPESRKWLLLCAHHFAFDGLGMVALLRSLLTGEAAESPDYTVLSARPRLPTDALVRFLRPADPVAPTHRASSTETMTSLQVSLSGPGVTARLAAACLAAVSAHNAEAGRPIRRVGISVAVGGVRGEAATYRRVDLAAQHDAEAAVARALADPRVPMELVGLPPGAFLLGPLLSRFSDTFLLSNLGRVDLAGVESLEFYPVARGRSAVSFGVAGLSGRPSTLTLRSRFLDADHASRLLGRVAEALP